MSQSVKAPFKFSYTGQTLKLCCPWGTQEMANKILSSVRGFQYQPYTASGAHINPAVELGDAFSGGSVYGGIYKKEILHTKPARRAEKPCTNGYVFQRTGS